MRFVAAAKSAPARYALLFAVISALVMGVLLTLIYLWMTSLLDRHIEQAVEQQMEVLRDDFTQDGRESVLGLVRLHSRRNAVGPVHYLLLDGAGRVLAGDLPAMKPVQGWQEIDFVHDRGGANERPSRLIGFGVFLDGDTFALVTHDTADLDETQRLLVQAFAIALAVTVALALFGGLTIGNLLVNRVEAVNRTARAIMAGDLSRRIPVVGRADELGGLAESLNRMLARIEELVGNVRSVTHNIAHDLRTPLGRMRQRLEAARVKPRTTAEYETVIDAAIDGTDDILKTFDAVLRIAQIEAGTVRERFTQVDLGGVTENVVDAFSAVAEDEGKHIVASVESGVMVRGDRELLTQMLVNLIENALRHAPTGASIAIRDETVGGRARITVSDDGPGIPASERERVFQRFYRLDASRSTPGSGLGLSLVGAIVKLHDATISLEDNQPGLRVVVVFP